MTRNQLKSNKEWRNKKNIPPWELEDFRWLFPSYFEPKSGDVQKAIVEQSREAILSVGHYRKNANHFHYLVNMELLLNKSLTEVAVEEGQEAPLTTWLKRARKSLNSAHQSEIVFNVIIYPDKRSNERVAHQLNKCVFDSTAHQLPVDITVEPRVTFSAKHAWLAELAKRASEVNGRVAVHFVDCGIVRGSTLRRTESLIASLLGDDQFQFSSVFQLVNRLSQKTLNHIAKEDCHFEFADISVGHLQTYDNSCYLCSYDRELRSVERSSSLASVAAMIRDKRLRETVEMRADEPAELVPLDHNRRAYWDPKEDVRLEWVKRQRWGYHRLAWTHWWNVKLSPLKDEKGKDRYNKSDVLERVVNTLRSELDQAPKSRGSKFLGGRPLALEHLMGGLASLADQPFAKQMGARDACLTIVLSLATAVIKGENVDLPPGYSLVKPDNWTDLQETVRNLCVKQSDLASDFVRCLMRQATMLGSSWLTRRDTVISLFKWAIAEYGYVNQADGAREKLKEFAGFYLYCLRLLLMAGNDRAKAARWEYLLIFGEEYKEEHPKPPKELQLGQVLIAEALRGLPERAKANAEGVVRDFVDMAFIDNTRITHSVLTSLGSIGENDDVTPRPFPPEFFQETLKWAGIADPEKCQDSLAVAGRALPTEWGPSGMLGAEELENRLGVVNRVWAAFTGIKDAETCLVINVPTKVLTLPEEPDNDVYRVERKEMPLLLSIASERNRGSSLSPTDWTKQLGQRPLPPEIRGWGAIAPRQMIGLRLTEEDSVWSDYDVLTGKETEDIAWMAFRLGIWRPGWHSQIREAYIAFIWKNRDHVTQINLPLKAGIKAVSSLRGRIRGMIMTERGDELMGGLVSEKITERQLVKQRTLNHRHTPVGAQSRELVVEAISPNSSADHHLFAGVVRDGVVGDINRWLMVEESYSRKGETLIANGYVEPSIEGAYGEAVPSEATLNDWLVQTQRWLYAAPEWTKNVDLYVLDHVVARSRFPLPTIRSLLGPHIKGIQPYPDNAPCPKGMTSAILLSACVQSACAHGWEDESGKKKVWITLMDGTHVKVSNLVEDTKISMDAIRRGLSRKDSGISLAVVAGFYAAISERHLEDVASVSSPLAWQERQVTFCLGETEETTGGVKLKRFSICIPILVRDPVEPDCHVTSMETGDGANEPMPDQVRDTLF